MAQERTLGIDEAPKNEASERSLVVSAKQPLDETGREMNGQVRTFPIGEDVLLLPGQEQRDASVGFPITTMTRIRTTTGMIVTT